MKKQKIDKVIDFVAKKVKDSRHLYNITEPIDIIEKAKDMLVGIFDYAVFIREGGDLLLGDGEESLENPEDYVPF